MSRIRGKDTAPETLLRRALWERGRRYRLHFKTPVGRPDVVFPTQKVAVFIDGCFWHGCPEHYVRPRSREDFWAAKLRENVDRDRRQTLDLEAQGWQVVRVWEHEVFTALEQVLSRVDAALTHQPPTGEEHAWRVACVEPLDEGGTHELRIHESLREPHIQYQSRQPRHTRKWGR